MSQETFNKPRAVSISHKERVQALKFENLIGSAPTSRNGRDPNNKVSWKDDTDTQSKSSIPRTVGFDTKKL